MIMVRRVWGLGGKTKDMNGWKSGKRGLDCLLVGASAIDMAALRVTINASFFFGRIWSVGFILEFCHFS